MSFNSMEHAVVFTEMLDQQMVEKSTTGWMEENASQVQYNGGAEVKIPKVVMSGLGNYDRDGGFSKGAVTVTYETKEMTQDRGRTFQLDAMDVDETNFAATAGAVMGEFQRTKVIPEIDAYRYSKIAQLAMAADRTRELAVSLDTVYLNLISDLTMLRDIVGDTEEFVIVMSAQCAGMLDLEKGAGTILQSGEFQQGDVKLKVKEIDGCPLIRVPSHRFMTKYNFLDGTDGTEGGFEAAADAKPINWMILAKRAPVAVSKTDVTRIFDPMTNQNANAWKIDYRKYHDLWITDNGMDGVLVNISA